MMRLLADGIEDWRGAEDQAYLILRKKYESQDMTKTFVIVS